MHLSILAHPTPTPRGMPEGACPTAGSLSRARFQEGSRMLDSLEPPWVQRNPV